MTELRELNRKEKEIYLQGYLKAKSEELAEQLNITESMARTVLIDGVLNMLRKKIDYDSRNNAKTLCDNSHMGKFIKLKG